MIILADNFNSEALTEADLRALALLLHQETEFLDQRRYEDWLALFTEDCRYWVPARTGQTDPDNEISLFHEDHNLMAMRAGRIQHPRAHSLTHPVTTSHITGDKVVEAIDGATGELTVTTRFQMVEHQRGEQRLFAGSYRYHLRRESGGYKISLKRVDLINCDACHEPLQVFI